MLFRRVVEELSDDQRRTLRQVVFWFVFAQLDLQALGAAAHALLLGVIAAAAGYAVYRKLVRGAWRISFFALHAGIVAALFAAYVQTRATAALIDGAAVAALATLELAHRKRALLVGLAVVHGMAIVFDPASAFLAMRKSEVIAGLTAAATAATARTAVDGGGVGAPKRRMKKPAFRRAFLRGLIWWLVTGAALFGELPQHLLPSRNRFPLALRARLLVVLALL